MNEKLKRILEHAYRCKEFDGACEDIMRWKPEVGHAPRGFYGALGELNEVRLVMILAEPADPGAVENHTAGIDSAFRFAERCYLHGNLYGSSDGHANAREIIRSCFPHLTLKQAMRRVWITESVLCSAPTSGGYVPAACASACVRSYLVPQLQRFPDAVIGAMGSKAYDRVRKYAPTEYIRRVVKCDAVFGRKRYYSPTWDILASLVRKLN